MKDIKVINLKHSSTSHYSMLKEVDGIIYEEASLVECANKLHEGKVDVALIPTSEYALYGDYSSLGYGLGCHLRSRFMAFYAHQPLHRIHTIYSPIHGSTGTLLLRLLLTERWRVNPRIVRIKESISPEVLGESEGLLVLHDEPTDIEEQGFKIAKDLVTVWHEWTGYPFIFLIWATRANSLTAEQCKFLQEQLQICHSKRSIDIADQYGRYDLPSDYNGEYVPDKFCHYYLEQDMVEGLNLFLQLSAKKGLLPESEYKITKSNIGSKSVQSSSEPEAVSDLLDAVVAGKRLSVKQGLVLATQANISDLVLVSELIRKRLYSETTLSVVLELKESQFLQQAKLERMFAEALELGCNAISIIPDPRVKVFSLDYYQEALSSLQATYSLPIEGLGVPRILELARAEDLEPEEVIKRLLLAGLSSVPAWGGEMLIDSKNTRGMGKASSKLWLDSVQILHALGVKTSAGMRLSENDTWHDRLLHLSKIRSQQDLTAGFWFFYTRLVSKKSDVSTEEYMRAIAVSRLFLDNVPSIQELEADRLSLPNLLSMSCGANAVRVRVSLKDRIALRDTVKMLKSVCDGKLAVREEEGVLTNEPRVH